MIKTVEELIAELQSLGNQHQKKKVIVMTSGIPEGYFNKIREIYLGDEERDEVVIDAS